MARILIGNIKGPKGNQGIQGIQGPIGPIGPQGPLPPLANNGLTTQAGAAALDAAYGKTLADGLSLVNSDTSVADSTITFTALWGAVGSGRKRTYFWDKPPSDLPGTMTNIVYIIGTIYKASSGLAVLKLSCVNSDGYVKRIDGYYTSAARLIWGNPY